MRLRRLVTVCLLLTAVRLNAQAPAPATPQTPAAAPAAQAPAAAAAPAKPFPYALALEAAQAAMASCQASNVPAVVHVMDTALNPRVVLVADNAGPRFIDFARRKAYTVIKSGMSTAEFAATLPPGQGRGGGPVNGDANLIIFPGGSPIRMGNDIVAALAVSGPAGGAADDLCVKAGLAKIQDRLK